MNLKNNRKLNPMPFKLSAESAKKVHAVEGLALRNSETDRFIQILSSSNSREIALKMLVTEFGNSAKKN